MSGTINFRINIAGFSGAAVTLFAAYNSDRDLLLVVAQANEYDGGARDGFLKITNQARDDAYDALFDADESINDAIRAYFELDSLQLLSMTQAVQRHVPGTKIERDGFSDSGVKYRIAPDMTNGQVAVMVACLYASNQRNVGIAEDFAITMLTITGDDWERKPARDWRLVEP
jgi:hypothetical protein